MRLARAIARSTLRARVYCRTWRIPRWSPLGAGRAWPERDPTLDRAGRQVATKSGPSDFGIDDAKALLPTPFTSPQTRLGVDSVAPQPSFYLFAAKPPGNCRLACADAITTCASAPGRGRNPIWPLQTPLSTARVGRDCHHPLHLAYSRDQAPCTRALTATIGSALKGNSDTRRFPQPTVWEARTAPATRPDQYTGCWYSVGNLAPSPRLRGNKLRPLTLFRAHPTAHPRRRKALYPALRDPKSHRADARLTRRRPTTQQPRDRFQPSRRMPIRPPPWSPGQRRRGRVPCAKAASSKSSPNLFTNRLLEALRETGRGELFAAGLPPNAPKTLP